MFILILNTLRQNKFKEAFILVYALEVDDNYLSLYSKTSSKEENFFINQQQHLLGLIQVEIFLKQYGYIKALYMLEKSNAIP